LIVTDKYGQIRTPSDCFGVRRPQGAAPILWGNPGLGQETIAIHIGSIIFEFGNCSEVRLEVISRDVVHGLPVFTAVVESLISLYPFCNLCNPSVSLLFVLDT
jgi:hypothetical protein